MKSSLGWLLVTALLLTSMLSPILTPASGQYATFNVVLISPNPMQKDTLHLSSLLYFNVTNTGAELDYITLQRSGLTITGPGVSGLAPGVSSPEFGVSLAPGTSGETRAEVDVPSPTAGTYVVTIPFKSELTGSVVDLTENIVVSQASTNGQGTVSGTISSTFGGPPQSLVSVEINDLNSTQPEQQFRPLVTANQFTQPLIPSTYSVLVDSQGFEGQTQVVKVTAGSTVNLQFSLSPQVYFAGPNVVVSAFNIQDSIWTLSASADLSRVATAPMTHNQPSPGGFHGGFNGSQTWNLGFGPLAGVHLDATPFQAADTYIGVSGDGKYAAGMDWNGNLYLINETSGSQVWSTNMSQYVNPQYPSNSEFRQGFFSSGATAFSPDGKLLVAGGSNGLLAEFSVPSGQVVWSRSFPDEIRALKFTPDGSLLAVGSGDWNLHMLHASSGAELWRGSNQFWPFFFVAMDSAGTLVGAGGKDGVFSLWDAHTGALKFSKNLFPGFVTGAGISDGGGNVMVSHWSYGVFYYDGKGNMVWQRRIEQAVAAMTPDGLYTFVGSWIPEMNVGPLYLLDKTGTVIWSYTPDLTKYCQSTISPFPRQQIKDVVVSESPDKRFITAIASCIGGTVFQFKIPLTVSQTATTSTTTSTSTSTTTSSATSSSASSSTSTATSTTTSTSTVPEFADASLTLLLSVLAAGALLLRGRGQF